MPIPAALAAKLKKRGIIKNIASRSNAQEEVEEVFAEDYDDLNPAAEQPYEPDDLPALPPQQQQQQALLAEPDGFEDDGKALVHEVVACPNKENRYHKCSNYCNERWGLKKFQLVPGLQYKQERLLRKHPLPAGWLEVGDPDTGRYYYWHTETDKVSWMPPTHQRAKIELPANTLKDVIHGGTLAEPDNDVTTDIRHKERRRRRIDEERRRREADSPDEEDDDASMDEDVHEQDDHDFEKLERELMREKRNRGKKQEKTSKRKEALDPMDPSSYSDVPRGGWTAGLELRGAAKTGVDVTATGPLFQQRPYPSPGAVLKMNRTVPDEADD